MRKPNCYDCKFRGEIPGSAHSCCTILKKDEDEKNPYTIMTELGLSTGKLELINEHDRMPLVKLNEHGVNNGWAAWPLNFDPVWVESCPFETPNHE
jgi:hypothetical protein